MSLRIPSGVTDQVFYFVAVDSTDLKTRETGLTTFTVYRSRNGSAAVAYTTPTVTEVSLANMPGVYKLLLDEDMTIASGNDDEEICIHITQASMAPVTRVFTLYRSKITAGNTLDVAATGEGGVDFGNILGTLDAGNIGANAFTAAKFATAALTAAKFGVGAINAAALDTSAVDEIVAAVWDRALTGGTHNIANSSGRRLRTLQESGSVYNNGRIWIDTINGTAGTTNYENGTSDNTVLTLADAKTISGSTGLSDFHIINGSIIALAESTANESYFGDNWSLALGGQAVGGAHFLGALVSGIGTSATEVRFDACKFGTASVQRGHFNLCSFANTLTLTLAGDYNFHNCFAEGDTSPIFAKTAGQAVVVEFHGWSGEVTISGIEAGDIYELGGSYRSIVLNGVDGTVHVHGLYEDIADNRTGSPVLTVTGAIKAGDVASTLARLPTVLVGGRIDSSVGAMAAAVMTATALAVDAVNKIRDSVLPKINTAKPNIAVFMVDSTDHVSPKTGLTVSPFRSIDGGLTFDAATGTVTEIADGMYSFDASAADMNGQLMIFKFTGTGADAQFVVIETGG